MRIRGLHSWWLTGSFWLVCVLQVTPGWSSLTLCKPRLQDRHTQCRCRDREREEGLLKGAMAGRQSSVLGLCPLSSPGQGTWKTFFTLLLHPHGSSPRFKSTRLYGGLGAGADVSVFLTRQKGHPAEKFFPTHCSIPWETFLCKLVF